MEHFSAKKMATMKKKVSIKNCKRLQCLMKKTKELSILCDVDAFFLCFENNSTGGGASSAAAPPSCCYNWPEDQQTFLSLIKKYKNSLNQPIKKKKKMMKESEQCETSQEWKMGSSHCFYGKRLEELAIGELQTMLCLVDDSLRAVEERIRFLTNPIGENNFKDTQVLQPSLSISNMAVEVLSDKKSENSQKEESKRMAEMHINYSNFLENHSLYTNGGELEMAGAASTAAAAPPSCCYNWPEDQQTFLSLIKKYKNSLNQPIKKKQKMMKESEQCETSQEWKMGSSHCFYGKRLEQTILCRVDDSLRAVEERILFLTNPIGENNFKDTQVLQPSLSISNMAAEVLSDKKSENSQKEEFKRMAEMDINYSDFLENHSPYTNGGELERAGGLLDIDFPGFPDLNRYYYSEELYTPWPPRTSWMDLGQFFEN